MQLGTRWAITQQSPQSLPSAMVEAIYEVELELHGLKFDTRGWHWTLTYLEGRPVVQLDDGTTITVNQAGFAHISEPN